MKAIRLLFILAIPTLVFGTEEKSVKSAIDEVTVFTSGAQVNREVKFQLVQGENILAFEGLSPELDERTIQFSTEAGTSIQSLNYEIRYNEATQARREEARVLSNKLESFKDQLREQNDILVVSAQEESVLLNNTDFDIWKEMNAAQLSQGLDLVRSRLTAIKDRQREARKKMKDINEERQKVLNRLNELRIEDAKPNGVLVVKLDADKAMTTKGKISYVVAEAGWEPYYDLRVEDISKPLKIEYKAKVYQQTGEEWKNVKITLSTGNPYQSGNVPELNPWYLNFISGGYYQQQNIQSRPQKKGVTGVFNGVVMDSKTAESIPFANVVLLNENGRMIDGVVTDVDGRFRIEASSPAIRMEVNFVGYQKYVTRLNDDMGYLTIRLNENTELLQEVVVAYEAPRTSRVTVSEDIVNMAVRDVTSVAVQSGGSGKVFTNDRYGVDGVTVRKEEFKISQNPVNLKFEVNRSYDVPSDGQQYKVAITTYEKEAEYLYKAVPKLNEHAFLTASITDWEELNLMNGKAGIYYEGTYLGETSLNPREAGDTLSVSLGKDENIVVLRKAIVSKEGKRILSGKKEEKFHYEIRVRNNKAVALKLEIKDQFPISGNDDITVERVESSGGQVDDKTGLIEWTFDLQPKEEQKLDLMYNVRYPKNRTINLK